jgi:hypothetical protein
MFCGICLFIFYLPAKAAFPYLPIHQHKAVRIASDHLNQLYQQEMCYEDIRYDLWEREYVITFYPAEHPELLFQARTSVDLDKRSLTEIPSGSIFTPYAREFNDNYYPAYFTAELKKVFISAVEPQWKEMIDIDVLFYDSRSRGLLYDIPELTEATTLEEVKDQLPRYDLDVIIPGETKLNETEREAEAEKMFALFQTIKEQGYRPHSLRFVYENAAGKTVGSLYFYHWKGDNPRGITLPYWNEIVSVEEILAYMDEK